MSEQVTAGKEDPSLRRRNYHHSIHELQKLMRSLRDGYDASGPCRANPDYRLDVPNTFGLVKTPRVGDMNEGEIDYWARRVAAADAEVSINQTNEALGRAKQRAGEAA